MGCFCGCFWLVSFNEGGFFMKHFSQIRNITVHNYTIVYNILLVLVFTGFSLLRYEKVEVFQYVNKIYF